MKKSIRKLMSLGMAAVLMAAMLAGCGSQETSQPAAEEAPAEETEVETVEVDEGNVEEEVSEALDELITPETAGNVKPNGQGYKVALCNFSLANTWRVEMQETFIYQCEQYKEQGIISEYYVTNSDGDVSQQVSDMADLVTKGVDLICLTAASASALVPAVEDAMDAGVAVVNFDCAVDTDDLTAKLILDNEEFGRVDAQWLADQLGGKGKIILIAGQAGTDNAEKRVNGAKNVIAQYSDMEIIAESYCDNDYAKAKAATESMLSAYPEIDGVLSLGGAMTRGAIDAFEEAGRELVPMCGEANNGYLKVWHDRVDQGFQAIAPISPNTSGAMALRLGIDALEGLNIKKDNTLTVNFVTNETLEDFVRTDLSDSFWAPTELPEEKLQELFGE